MVFLCTNLGEYSQFNSGNIQFPKAGRWFSTPFIYKTFKCHKLCLAESALIPFVRVTWNELWTDDFLYFFSASTAKWTRENFQLKYCHENFSFVFVHWCKLDNWIKYFPLISTCENSSGAFGYKYKIPHTKQASIVTPNKRNSLKQHNAFLTTSVADDSIFVELQPCSPFWIRLFPFKLELIKSKAYNQHQRALITLTQNSITTGC